MSALIAIVVFIVVALIAFAVGSLLDQRSAQARLIRERLAVVEKAAERAPSEELALLRDEMLSKIPALDSLLRRSAQVSSLQALLAQADLGIRAGNILMLCVVSGLVFSVFVFMVTASMPGRIANFIRVVGPLVGTMLPYWYASYRRNKRFQKFEELFPEA